MKHRVQEPELGVLLLRFTLVVQTHLQISSQDINMI